MTKIAAYYFVINNFAIKSISNINIDAKKADNLEINIFSTDDNSILTGTKRNKQSDFITRTNFKINCNIPKEPLRSTLSWSYKKL